MPDDTFSSHHVGVAAEAFAAAVFARFGMDVSVQYGANQPEYDLVVVRGNTLLKVSVKGSKTGSWGLTQSYLENADYNAAADAWLRQHQSRTAFCLVQFKGVEPNAFPRMYLATPKDIARRLKETPGGRGGTILYEYRLWTARAAAAGTVDRVPESWTFSRDRLEEILRDA
jgi:Holliday junction resolvase-like predicted endonuclease